ncbi:hypothetical protein TSST111916_16000 [Tsukamurella strandjordii]
MKVLTEHEGGAVSRVYLPCTAGAEVEPVNRYLAHLIDAAYSPNTVAGYAYDLRHLLTFLAANGLSINDFRPLTAFELLGYLRRIPSRRPAQRLGLAVATDRGRLLAPSSVQRILAATSSFYEWAIAVEYYTAASDYARRLRQRLAVEQQLIADAQHRGWDREEERTNDPLREFQSYWQSRRTRAGNVGSHEPPQVVHRVVRGGQTCRPQPPGGTRRTPNLRGHGMGSKRVRARKLRTRRAP